jgi:hypothetical protein
MVCRRAPRAARGILSAAAVALVLGACTDHAGSSAGRSSTSRPAPPRTKPAVVDTSLTPRGVVSSAVVAENAKAGTTAWKLANQGPGFVQGFADKNYAAVGDSVTLYVSTDATSFSVVAYRMGWYRGTGARAVWSSPPVAGGVQPACPVAPDTNMVACDNWARSLSVPITAAFVPGDYLFKLTGAGGQQNYVLLTVWDPASAATYLVMNRSLVEQGWNTYGGYSYYEGRGPCLLDNHGYPPCNRARVVSFDRPFAGGHGSSDFLDNEYPLVEYAEEIGLDVTYCTDICVSEHPSFLLRHKALIGLDHDETWTNSERVGALDALHAGVNMAFFGAATLVRHARLEPSPLGSDRQQVDYRDSTEDPLNGHGDPMEVTGNTWAAPPSSWTASTFTGLTYSGFVRDGQPSQPLVVWDPSAWVFRGLKVASGSSFPGMINSDIDHISPGPGLPPGVQVLAHSPIPLSLAYTNQGSWNGSTYSDMTYYTDPSSKGGVFSSGDNIWVHTLEPCAGAGTPCSTAFARAVTANVFWLFGQGPAGTTRPSVPNWSDVVPPGS